MINSIYPKRSNFHSSDSVKKKLFFDYCAIFWLQWAANMSFAVSFVFYVWKQCLCTCWDDILSCLESLIIKMVLCAQYKHQVNICIAQVHIGNWNMETDTGDERFGSAFRGTGPLHLANWQSIVDLETKKQQITDCKLRNVCLIFKHCMKWSISTVHNGH